MAIETKSLIAPLSYFVEDFLASNDATRLGSDLDVSPKAGAGDHLDKIIETYGVAAARLEAEE
eukprot:6739534-Ditylum_brightwellii.AAC.1